MFYLHLYDTDEKMKSDYNGNGYTEPWVSLAQSGLTADKSKIEVKSAYNANEMYQTDTESHEFDGEYVYDESLSEPYSSAYTKGNALVTKGEYGANINLLNGRVWTVRYTESNNTIVINKVEDYDYVKPLSGATIIHDYDGIYRISGTTLNRITDGQEINIYIKNNARYTVINNVPYIINAMTNASTTYRISLIFINGMYELRLTNDYNGVYVYNEEEGYYMLNDNSLSVSNEKPLDCYISHDEKYYNVLEGNYVSNEVELKQIDYNHSKYHIDFVHYAQQHKGSLDDDIKYVNPSECIKMEKIYSIYFNDVDELDNYIGQNLENLFTIGDIKLNDVEKLWGVDSYETHQGYIIGDYYKDRIEGEDVLHYNTKISGVIYNYLKMKRYASGAEDVMNYDNPTNYSYPLNSNSYKSELFSDLYVGDYKLQLLKDYLMEHNYIEIPVLPGNPIFA